jgi:hydroxysqualene synthase
MTDASALRSGKTHQDENFPVASRLIHPRHRGIILAFYNFVRTADDIADHATLAERTKLALLDRLEQGLLGQCNEDAAAIALRGAVAQRNLTPRHAQDLLDAFRLDVTKRRYADWDDLISYCRLSAMPVGRFVLDVHGESRAIWPANDALCAALQIINHLQDSGEDFRNLDRVYVPLDALARAGTDVAALREPRASPALRACLKELAQHTGSLLEQAAPFSDQIMDFRLAMEVSVIHALARHLVGLLMRRDPLSERVHLTKASFAVLGCIGIARALRARLTRKAAIFHPARDM